jgi:hypothetical protein
MMVCPFDESRLLLILQFRPSSSSLSGKPRPPILPFNSYFEAGSVVIPKRL